MASMRTGLAEPGVSPVEAALRILDRELGGMTSWLATHDDPVQASAMIQRFGTLIRATPSLRAHLSDMMDQFVAVAAAILAERAGMSADDPEPQVAATAVLGLRRIQSQGLRKYLDGTRTGAPGSDRERPPRSPAHRHRTELVRGLHARYGWTTAHPGHRRRCRARCARVTTDTTGG